LPRAVLDSNIFVSAVQFGGRPQELLRAAEDGRDALVLSEPILTEVTEVLVRKSLWSPGRVSLRLERIRSVAVLTPAELEISACEDPDDNRILEAAVPGAANFIVSGDDHLLRMKISAELKL
jgi:putative PIN family toxin of toxin-antitoxin system